ncbi:hypothetical protein OPV22_009894 [Ensete ventricosum]|uniref:MI domain-containing protein n=1 Tax=Ensete ventricosum TaxID=4639 RepID=A0AAV8RED5_ENSVE|nr:hypothetical protein OPV22_009894 [Ensete ventricosum]
MATSDSSDSQDRRSRRRHRESRRSGAAAANRGSPNGFGTSLSRGVNSRVSPVKRRGRRGSESESSDSDSREKGRRSTTERRHRHLRVEEGKSRNHISDRRRRDSDEEDDEGKKERRLSGSGSEDDGVARREKRRRGSDEDAGKGKEKEKRRRRSDEEDSRLKKMRDDDEFRDRDSHLHRDRRDKFEESPPRRREARSSGRKGGPRHEEWRRDGDSGHRREQSSDEEESPRWQERNNRNSDRRSDDRRRDYDSENRRDRTTEEGKGRDQEIKKVESQPPPVPASDSNMGRTGGIYIPPHRMAQMMREVQDKSSEAYQRLSWDALRKSINGLVNKVNATNIKNIVPELFMENLIRGRGLFCRSCMKSQMASPGFTDVFAALVAVVNTKFPLIGRLLVVRIVLQLKRAFKRNDKPQLLAATKFIAHLVNQLVAHEVIALELLTVLLENPTDDSVEVAVGFVKECGALLQDISPQGLHGIFERFRGILHEGEIDKRVQFLIEGLFAIRKAKFQGFPAIRPELDLVEQEEQLTHEISLDEEIDPETHLDVFKPNSNFLDDEKAYEDLKKRILEDESSKDEEGSDVVSDDEEEEESEEDETEEMKIKDETETNLVNLRRTIYLTIMSSVDFEEAGHKLLKIKLEPGQEMELCIMLLECCSQERTYLRYYGLLGQRFCMINKVYQENFEKCFVQQYSMIHRLETNKLRNVAKFFAHLLGTDALPWHVLAYIRLTEEDTTSSSRIFIKILFQELSEHLGIRLLNERLNDPTMQDSFDAIFPKDNPKNTRFAINFFTSIGLGAQVLTLSRVRSLSQNRAQMKAEGAGGTPRNTRGNEIPGI